MSETNPGNIVVIEDDMVTATLEKTILENAGYKVEIFTLGSEGLDRILRGDLDLVLLDYMLPDMSGGDIITALGDRLQTLPVIVITGHGNDLLAVNLIMRGAADYLVKGMPNFVHVLTTTVKSTIDRFSLTGIKRELEVRLKDSEETSRRTFQALPDPAYIWQREGDASIVLTLVNQAGQELMGTIATDAIGKSLEQFFTNEPEINANIVRVLQKGEPVTEERYCNLFFDEKRWFNLDYVEFTKNGVMFIAKDITDQKSRQEARQIELDTLETKVRERTNQLSEKNRQLRAEISERRQAETAIRNHLVLEELLASISSQFVASVDLDQDLDLALEALGKGVHACRTYIYRLNWNGRDLDIINEWCEEDIETQRGKIGKLDDEAIRICASVFAEGDVVNIGDVESLPDDQKTVRDLLASLNVKSVLRLPIHIHGQPSGYIGLDHTKEKNAWVDDHVRLLKTASEIIGSAITVMEDRQQIVESEEKYRNVVERATEGIVIVQDSLLKYSNQRLAQIIGRDVNDIVGKEFSNYIHPEELTHVEEMQLQQLEEENESITYETALIDRDDGKILVEFNSGSVTIDGFPAVMIFIRDITERVQLEKQLRHSQKMEAIGTLSAGVAHEINTPIQFVGDNMTFLTDSFGDITDMHKKLDETVSNNDANNQDFGAVYKKIYEEIELDYLLEEIPKAIEQSKNGAARVADIVKAMKTFAHPGSEEKSVYDVNKAIENTVTVARNEWKYVAEVQTDLESDLAPISCLPSEVNQVFLNLIVNAAHAIADANKELDREKGKITIKTRHVDDSVEISIADTGTGIPTKIRERIFDPFFTTKEIGKGTGQGLNIAHSVVVEKHGGSLKFDSKVGKGTTFFIRLPYTE